MKAILLDEAKKWLEENCENQYTRMAVLGIMQSMPTVDYQETPNEPLTLEQLWEIDGHPVWSKKHKEWFLLCKRPSRYMMYDRNGFCLPVRDAIEYGLYSYPLDHIDQEAWTAKWEVDEFGHKCSKCGEYLPSGDDDIFPQFCPNCGRATTADALEELEKRLRG